MASYWAKLLCSPPNEPGKLATLTHLRKRGRFAAVRRNGPRDRARYAAQRSRKCAKGAISSG